MPRVHFVKSARKANPVAQPGQSYYWWKFRHGGKRYSLKYPRPSMLTQSEYLSTLRSLVEQVQDFDVEKDGGADNFEALRDEIVSAVCDLRDMQQDNLDNMPESLQSSPTGELLQERIDALDSAESEIENLDVESIDRADFDDDEEWEAACEEQRETIESHISEMEDYLSCADL